MDWFGTIYKLGLSWELTVQLCVDLQTTTTLAFGFLARSLKAGVLV